MAKVKTPATGDPSDPPIVQAPIDIPTIDDQPTTPLTLQTTGPAPTSQEWRYSPSG